MKRLSTLILWTFLLLIKDQILLANENPSPYFFIENKGQWPVDVLYRANLPGGKLFLQNNSLKYLFYDTKKVADAHNHSDEGSSNSTFRTSMDIPGEMINLHAIEMEFVNANSNPSFSSEIKRKEYYNYFTGSASASHAEAYEKINYKNIYNSIDFVLYSAGINLKYDFIINPGGEARDIILQYKGAENISAKHGNLYIKTSLNTLIEQKPFAYQLVNQDTISVECRFLLNYNKISFSFPNGYDKNIPLVIDPLLIFSTFSGSFADNWGFTATYGEKGVLYSGGIVFDLAYPFTIGPMQTNFGGTWDVGIIKFDSTGSNIIYSTYLGGSNAEAPHSLLVNNAGELLIFGTTSSFNFPISASAYDKTFNGGSNITPVSGVTYQNGSDLFVSKINTSGTTLVSSTYFGGSKNDGILYQNDPLTKNYGDQFRGDIIVDIDNNIYVASNTTSNNIPIVDGFQSVFGGGTHDGVVFKMNADLTQLVWSTYMGGTGTDAAYSVKLDKDNNVYTCGGTSSSNFPTTAGTIKPIYSGTVDGFVTRISKDGKAVVNSTYIGTTSYDQTYFLDIDGDENIYLLGQTKGLYPVTANVYNNPRGGQFIHKMNKTFDQTIFSTVFGSNVGNIINPNISPTAFLASECQNIYVAGWGGITNATTSGTSNTGYNGGTTAGLPITQDAIQKTTNGTDFYLLVLSKDADKLLYATYFGGAEIREHVDGGTSRFDKKGIVYHVVCAGCGANSLFTTTPGAWSRTNNSADNCNMASFKFDLSSVDASFDLLQTKGCNVPFRIGLTNTSSGGVNYLWDFGDGTTSTNFNITSHIYNNPGQYKITLSASNAENCGAKTDIATQTINVYVTNFEVGTGSTICKGESYQLSSSGGVSYKWTPVAGLSNSNAASPIASPSVTTMYKVRIIDGNSCEHIDSILVEVAEDVIVDFEPSFIMDCGGLPKFQFINKSQNIKNYMWDFGDGTFSTEESPIHEFEKDSIYQIRLEDVNHLCGQFKVVSLPVVKMFVPNIFTPNGDNKNETFEIRSQESIELTVFNRWGREVYKSDNYQNNWKAEGLPSGVYYYSIFDKHKKFCKGWIHVLK